MGIRFASFTPVPSGMSKTTGPTIALIEFLHLLRSNTARTTGIRTSCAMRSPISIRKSGMPAIPAGHVKLALIIRVDQADQIAQHDAVLGVPTPNAAG